MQPLFRTTHKAVAIYATLQAYITTNKKRKEEKGRSPSGGRLNFPSIVSLLYFQY